MTCPRCAAESLNAAARFCTKCGAVLTTPEPSAPKRAGVAHWIAFPFVLLGRALSYPIRKRQERIQWLTEASGPDSPIKQVPGLSDGAKRVYAYLASVTLRYGSSHSRVRTIARVAGLSENRARQAIRELERRGLLSHQRRITWHGRGAHSYYVKPITRERRFPRHR